MKAGPAELFSTALDKAIDQLVTNISDFREAYPAESTQNGRYGLLERRGFPTGSNCGWTSGFWAGAIWLAANLNRSPALLNAGKVQVASFVRRLKERVDIDRYELGFLYSPSCVMAWHVAQDPSARQAAHRAARHLARTVYLPNARVFPSAGPKGDGVARGRTIIDTCMSMPLLFWAADEQNEPELAEIAQAHLRQLGDFLIRDDGTTFHVRYFDPASGVAGAGTTAQGAHPLSTWSRGQAWAILGFAVAYRYTQNAYHLDCALRVLDAYRSRLPADGIPVWDMVLDAAAEPRDSSAAAIAICGMLELAPLAGRGGTAIREEALRHLATLCTAYSAASEPRGGMLAHGVQNKPANKGVDEANLWGDYFYLEALCRVRAGESFRSCW